jgi:hypothetical protein
LFLLLGLKAKIEVSDKLEILERPGSHSKGSLASTEMLSRLVGAMWSVRIRP